MTIKKIPPVIWAALIGIAAFLFYTGGGTILRPTYTEWLMRGDFGQHFLGWNFFRHTPMLQFPLGANGQYGETLGSSIVFTDSTPLFAFIFKPIAALLPEPFQYIGIWLALTVMLQGVFAYKLLSLFSTDRLTVLLATAFFVIAPPFWWRIYLESDALSAHWLILAALYLYFNEQFRQRGWLVLLCVASLTHAYLLAMVLAIWAANLLQRALKKQLSFLTIAIHGLVAAVMLALVMWATGYFMLHDGLSTPVGSYFRMSLLGLFDPASWWSTILPDQQKSGGEYEGQSYLGSGILALLIILVPILFFSSKRRATLTWRWWTLLPLLAIAVILTLQALTTYIGWGEHNIFVYSVPPVVQRYFGVFRVAGRMFWPVFYLIYVGIFCLAFKLVGRKWLACLLAALLLFQLIDGNNATQYLRKSLRDYQWQSPLQSAFWKQLPATYRRIAVVMPSSYSYDYFPVALFASEHGMSINHGYFARMDTNKLQLLQRQTSATIFTGNYDPHTLYVFYKDPLSVALWEQAKLTAGAGDFFAVFDDYRVLVPGWKNCNECQHLNIKAAPAPHVPPPEYVLGTTIDFRSGGNGAPYLAGGWYDQEDWGRWSITNLAGIQLSIPAQISADLTLEINGHSYVTAQYPQQTVQVSANGQSIGELRYTHTANQSVQSLRIPAALIAKNHDELLLVFTVATPISPLQARESKDMRTLGLGIVSMTIH
ncbi:DUF6311 domain-containing protein [Glaciimonas soli]|uniref:Membrane protein 6-pyruvoyl-tetrahydropterin synthase-related domain-containing protein n=1 Tax=Glaciimonas soli TaxID=2590999 RepID=A0A843YRQ1_9BURK|nr:DUF6311 domain-containing protein [Glaciimonas soli]MQR02429.1 hypothetical protein [Glaciimonas soli]